MNLNNKGEKEMKPLISIIVPCYNVEKWIDRCILSLINQTIGVDNLQIILVNDASTDNTFERLKIWEEQYSEQILVISYDKNMRQGYARNVGLSYALADYIGFVDSDDWIEPQMYANLYEYALKYQADVTKCKFIRDPGNAVINHQERQDVFWECPSREGLYYNNLSYYGNNGEYGGVCTGLYKKEILMKNNIFFPENLTYEDNFWGRILELYTKTIYIIDEIYYHYFINLASTVCTKGSSHHLDRLEIEVMLTEELNRRNAFNIFYEENLIRFLQMFYLNTLFILFTRYEVTPEIFTTMQNTIKHYFPDYLERIDLSKYGRREQALIKLIEIPNMGKEDIDEIKDLYLKSLLR